MGIAVSSADIDNSSTALSHHFGLHLSLGLAIGGLNTGADPKAAELKEPPPQADSGPHPKVALAQGDEGREKHHGVGAEVVRLKAIEIQEISEEFAHRKPKSAVEVGAEDHLLAGLGHRHELRSGDAEVDVLRQLAGAAEHEYLHLGDIGSLPSTALATGGAFISH